MMPRLTKAEERKARERANRFAKLQVELEHALATGQALRWCMSQRSQWVRLLAENGIELLSATQLRKRKIALLPEAKPVVWAYFGAPIAKYRPLYWIGRQTICDDCVSLEQIGFPPPCGPCMECA